MSVEITERECKAIILSLATGQKNCNEKHFRKVERFILDARTDMASANLILSGDIAVDATGKDLMFRLTTDDEKKYIRIGMEADHEDKMP